MMADPVDPLAADPSDAEPVDPLAAETFDVQANAPINMSPAGDFGATQPAPLHLGKPGEVTAVEPDTYKLSADQLDRANRIDSVFRQSWVNDADRAGAMQRFAKQANLRYDVVRENFPELEQSWKAAKFDPVRWMMENEHLSQLVLDHPELGATVERDVQLSTLHRAWNWVLDHDFGGFLMDHPELLDQGDEAKAKEAFAIDIALRNAPRKQTFTKDQASDELKEGFSVLGGGLAVPNRVLVPFKRFGEMWDQMRISKTQYEIMRRRDAGLDTYQLETKLQDMQLSAVQRDYNEGPIEQVFSDVMGAAASSAYPMVNDAAPLAVAGGLGAGAATLAITKSPALAGRAFVSGAAMMGKTGAVYGTFQLESGTAYGDMLAHGIDERRAAAAAKIYGTLAAGVEFATWGPMFKTLGPVGAMLKEGSTEAFTKALVKSSGFRAMLKNIATEGLAEGGEEFLQDATQQAVEYFARAHQVGFEKASAYGPSVDLGQSFEAGVKGVTGGWGLAVTHAGIHMVTRAMTRDRAHESLNVVEMLANLDGSQTALADPEAVAENLKGALAPKALYIAPEEVMRFHQDAHLDVEQEMTKLLGPEGPRLLQEAVATGSKLEIPLAKYIDWKSDAKKGLIEHTVTDPSLPTGAQIDEKVMKEHVDALAKQFESGEKSEPETVGEAQFLDVAEKQLATETGDAVEARQKMQLMRATIRTWASRFGIDASEMFRDAAIHVEAGRGTTAAEILSERARLGEEKLNRAEELYRDEATGLPNDLAFKDSPRPANRPMVARVAVEGIKWLNDNVSHERADMLYRAIAQALHGVGQEAYKVDGDFVFYTKGDEGMAGVLEKVRAALPENLRGFAVTGATGQDLDVANKKLQATHESAIAAGTRANPRPLVRDEHGMPALDTQGEEQVLPPERPKGISASIDPKALEFSSEKPTPVISPQLTELAKNLTPEAYFNKAYVDPNTGEWTKRGWDALPRKKHIASIDLAGLRLVNDRFGKEYGNQMIKMMGLSAELLGGKSVDFARLHGDEYAAQSDDPKALEVFVENLRAYLSGKSIQFKETETGELTLIPVEFHHGYGEHTLEAADADLNERKRRLKKAARSGLARRGSKPSGPQRDGGADAGSDSGGHSQAYSAAKALIARARGNKASYQEWFEWCVDKKGKGERPKVAWAIESTMASYGVVDPVNGFSGNEAGKDLSAKSQNQRAHGGGSTAESRRNKGVGLIGNAADMEQNKYTTPSGRNFFQAPGPNTLFYQFPTPEESLQNMQAQQVFNDLAMERGAQVVDDSDALIDSMKREVGSIANVGGLNFTVWIRREGFVGAITGGQFEDAKAAEHYIRQHAGDVAGVVARDSTQRVLGSPSTTLDALAHNLEQNRNLDIPPGNPDSFAGVQSSAGLAALKSGPDVLRIEKDPITGREEWVDSTSNIPKSKNLPGQVESEAATARGGLGSIMKMWKVETPADYTGKVKLFSGPRGYTEIFNEGMKRLFKVVLNPTADHSTFLHEASHIFLELMTDLAARPDAPQQLKDDYATVLKYLDAKGPEDLKPKDWKNKEDAAVVRHEKWARSFERYLLEGKAPARKLVRMFERFRLWLSKVYRDPQMLGVELNDEIKGVFDRMVATDREIENYQKAMGLGDQLLTPNDFDSPEKFEAYLEDRRKITAGITERLDYAARQDKLREQEAWWKEEYRKELHQAEEDYEVLPARRAQQTLAGKGELWGLGDTQFIQLDRELVEKAVGKEAAKKFRTTTKADAKVDPGDVADFLGYPSGEAMLKDILELQPKDSWSKTQATEAMHEKHPDVVNDIDRMREEISKGLHGDATEAFLLKEWAAFRIKVSQQGTPAWTPQVAPIDAYRDAASVIVSKKLVGRLDVGQTLRAERKNAEQATFAAAKRNFRQALVYKGKQLLNMYVWRSLTRATEDRDAFLELADQLSKDIDGRNSSKKSVLGKASPIYREGAAALLEAIGLRAQNPDGPGASIDDIVRQMEKDGQVIGIDQPALEAITVKPRGWKDLTVAEMRTIKDALSSIRAAARGVTTALYDGKRIDFGELAQRITEEGSKLPPIPPGNDPGAETYLEKVREVWHSADGSMLKQETMVHWLGNHDIHSPIFRGLVLPLQEAKHKEVDLLRGPVRRIIDAFDAMPRTIASRQTERIDGKALFPGHTTKIAAPQRRWQILMMLLNAGNASNLSRLTEGRGITEQQMRDAAVKVGITKEEYDWIQSVWDACEDLKKPAFDLEERDTGIRPEAIEARAFETPHGAYRGGYFPAVYDRRGNSDVGERQHMAQFQDPTYTPIGTARPHLKARADDFSDIISLAPQSIYRHLSQVAHDIAFREAVRSVGRLVLDKRVKGMLDQRLGVERARTFLQWVKDIGQMRGIEGATHVPAFLAVMQALRGGLSMAALGGSLQNAAEDLTTGLTTAALGSELEAKHVAAGIAAVRGGLGRQAMADAEAQSGELRARRGQMSRELLSTINQMISKSPLSRGPLRFMKDHAFAVQEQVDRMVATSIWLGAQRQALANGESTADAVVFADKIVRQVLPSHHVVDTAALLRDRGFVGASLVFFRFWSTAYNVGRRHGPAPFSDYTSGFKNAGEAIGYAIALQLLGSLVRGQGPDPGEPWEQWFMRKLVTGSLSKLPWAGELSEMAWSAAFGGRARDPRNNSIAGMLMGIYKEAAKAADGDKEADVRLEAALKAMGLGLGLPVGQPIRSGFYGYRAATGRVNVRGTWDVIGGLAHGQSQHQPANIPTLIEDAIEGGVQGIADHPGPQ